jgi:hypothetical protein
MRRSVLVLSILISGIVLATPAARGERHRIPTGTVTGSIGITNVGPMMGGAVFFYNADAGPPPSSTHYWLVPTYAFTVDQNARFTVALPEGTYYVGAIERLNDPALVLGPPDEGDHLFIAADAQGKPKQLTVWANATINLGTIVGGGVYTKASQATKGVTAIRGIIRGEDGKPTAGMIVYAYASPNMLEKPLYISDRSDKEGRYQLRFAKSGKYYLMARTNLGGGPPMSGEQVGVYRDGTKPVSVRTGEVRAGINIDAFLFDIFDGHFTH